MAELLLPQMTMVHFLLFSLALAAYPKPLLPRVSTCPSQHPPTGGGTDYAIAAGE